MNFFKHAYKQPFIFATGLAALIHSTWSLGTMFSGEQPAIENITTTIGYVHFTGWIVPALLIAFALDVGQIITSHEIRTRGMTKSRGVTFVVFSLATYYLQWLYMAHHMPSIPLASGISDVHLDAALWLRNMALWLIPSLLPLSTLLYTFSSDTDESRVQLAATEQHTVSSEIYEITHDMPVLEMPQINLLEAENPVFNVRCDCGWTRTYNNADSSARGLKAHQQKCTVYQEVANHEVTYADAE